MSSAPGNIVNYDASKKHPLKHQWVLWYDQELKDTKRPSHANWGSSMKEILTISTVEDFWRLYNNIAQPSDLHSGCTYNFFKKGVDPKWEDPANERGGRWLYKPPRNKLNEAWQNTLLACIGQILEGDDKDEITGAVVNVNDKVDKVSIWVRTCEEQLQTGIGKNYRQALFNQDSGPKLDFKNHATQKARNLTLNL